jgi:EmrB/QacA subfamily drug resistance transporter
MPLTLTLLSAAFPPERRTAALGLWSSIAGLGVALGPLLGGVIVETLDWHWIFWINVPVGLAAAALAPRRLTESRGAQTRLDLPGLAFASGGLLGIVWATTRGNTDGWTSPSTLLAYATGVLLLGAFIWQERRSAAPMLPLALFRRPGFAAANGAGFGLHFTMFAAFFLIIQYLTRVHGDSALAAGVETLPWTLLPLAVSPFTGALGGRIGSRPLIVGGLLLLAAGTLGAALAMSVGASYAALVAPLVAIGLGIAFVLPNVASAALGSALPEHIGKASGTNSTFRQLGSVFGIAVAVLVFDRAGSYTSPETVVDGVRAALFVAAAGGVLGAIAALGIPARPGTRGALARPARAAHSAT